jgi:hypothetical protein
MTKTQEIPADVMAEAEAINLTLPYRHVQETIARALMARDTAASTRKHKGGER